MKNTSGVAAAANETLSSSFSRRPDQRTIQIRSRRARSKGIHGVSECPTEVKGAKRRIAAAHVRRDKLVLEHLPLVKAIAVRVRETLPSHVELDDLIQAGVFGLFDAAARFSSDKQVIFPNYAKHRIRGAILDSLRQLDWASRDMRRRHKQVDGATRELATALHRNPTEAEVAAKLGIDIKRWRKIMLDLHSVGLVSASTRPGDQEDLPAPDVPDKSGRQPDSICAQEHLRRLLGDATGKLPQRYQSVVTLYYGEEMTMKEIGTILGINESRVSQIHKSALAKMAVALQSRGITSAQAF